MIIKAEQILHDSISLSPIERAAIAEELLSSIDRPDAQVDALWAAEAEARLTAYDVGNMEAIPAAEVFNELDQ